MIEVFKIVKQKYDATIVTEISVNSSSFTIGNSYKLLNQTFTTTYGSIHLHLGYPRLVCGTRLLTGARLLSVQVNQTPGLYAGPGVYPRPSFYPKFYGKYCLFSLTVFSLSPF